MLQTVQTEDIATVEGILPAGSAVPGICEAKLKQMFPNLKIVFNIYGQTECGVVSLGKENANLGTIAAGCMVKVVDPNTGKICKPNEEGELCIKTECMMLEYLERPGATKQYFDEQGFGRSGDLGYYDEKGRLYYVDRIKELIK